MLCFWKSRIPNEKFPRSWQIFKVQNGASIQGGGTVCYDLCSGDITVQGDLSASVYATLVLVFLIELIVPELVFH